MQRIQGPLTAAQELAAVAAPVVRAYTLSHTERILGAVLAAAMSALLHPGVGGLLLLVATSMTDYRLGRAVALARGEYRQDLAALGKIGKISGVALVALLLATELWISAHPGWVDSRQLVAGTLAFWLAIEDARSIVGHMRAAGRNVPDWLDKLLDAGQKRAAPPAP